MCECYEKRLSARNRLPPDVISGIAGYFMRVTAPAAFSRDGEHPRIFPRVPREADGRPVKGNVRLTELNNATLAPRAIQGQSECEIPNGLSDSRRSSFFSSLASIVARVVWPPTLYVHVGDNVAEREKERGAR